MRVKTLTHGVQSNEPISPAVAGRGSFTGLICCGLVFHSMRSSLAVCASPDVLWGSEHQLTVHSCVGKLPEAMEVSTLFCRVSRCLYVVLVDTVT